MLKSLNVRKMLVFMCTISIFTWMLISTPVVFAANTSYYVDAVNGNDSNNGTSTSTAWKTLGKISNMTFSPGDKIFLKKGCVWNGEQLSPKGSGSSTNPITIDAYGSGSAPVLNGNGMAGAVVYLENQSYWVIQNLEITNNAARDVNSTVYREGILVRNTGSGTVSGIQVKNNYVHNVMSFWRYTNGYDPHMFGGIAFLDEAYSPGTSKFDNIVISNNTVSYTGRCGIVVWDKAWAANINNTAVPKDGTFELRPDAMGAASTNINVSSNTLSYTDGDAILLYGVNNSMMQYNVSIGAGQYYENNAFNNTAAIWCRDAQNVTMQFNEAYNTVNHGDGTGFDIDLCTKDIKVQFNYSHNNEGGFLLLMHNYSPDGTILGSTVRYNISQNDTVGFLVNGAESFQPVNIYNNTIYMNSSDNQSRIIQGSDYSNCNNGLFFKNNIFCALGNAYMGNNTQASDGQNHYDYNIFYGNQTGAPNDPHKITSDPMFVNPGSAGNGRSTVNGYKLNSGSPALNSGILVPNNGGKDYWGNTVSSTAAPNRGAYNEAGIGAISGPDLVVTDINWLPTSPADGDEVTFSAVIKNQGTTASPAGTIHGVAFSIDNIAVSWSDTYTQSIPVGQTVTVTANYGPNNKATWKASSGTHTVMANVDDINRISESNENNNAYSKSITTGQCDLTVVDITWAPASPSSGNEVTFYARVKNQGNVASPAGIIHGVAFSVNGAVVSWSAGSSASIAPGETVTLTADGGSSNYTWTAERGTYTVMANVDDVNRISESNENNNTMTKTMTVN